MIINQYYMFRFTWPFPAARRYIIIKAHNDIPVPFDANRLKLAYNVSCQSIIPDGFNPLTGSTYTIFKNPLTVPTYKKYIESVISDMKNKQDQSLATLVTRKQLSNMITKEFIKEMWFVAPCSYGLSYIAIKMVFGFILNTPLAIIASVPITYMYLSKYFASHERATNRILDVYY